jgi:hypothetical protein
LRSIIAHEKAAGEDELHQRPIGYPTPCTRKDRFMPNLNPQAPLDNSKNSAARDYLRSFLAETSWSIGVTTEILERYLQLGQDEMAFHSIRQIRAMVKALLEAARRLHELKRQDAP